MTSIQQLRCGLISNGDQPSTTLTAYFKVGKVEIIKTLLCKLLLMFPIIFSPSLELHYRPNAGCAEAARDI